MSSQDRLNDQLAFANDHKWVWRGGMWWCSVCNYGISETPTPELVKVEMTCLEHLAYIIHRS